MTNRAIGPERVIKHRNDLATTATQQLVSWINDQLPKRFVGKEVYLDEGSAPESYTFRKIRMTNAIRDKVKKEFENTGWQVRYQWAQWWFNVPQNMELSKVI